MNQKITKSEIIENIYEATNIEKDQAALILDALLNQIKINLEKGNTIELRGFGTFEPRLRKGREKARNPKTGEFVLVEPHYVAAFRAGQSLKNNLLKLPVKEQKK
ncbi:MAG: integration host factor subunit beta [Treponema sp.]|nr:integration host factor subunit beta [Treponema sp.]